MFSRPKVLLILSILLGAVVYDRFFHDSKFFTAAFVSDFLTGLAPSSELKERIAALEEENENLRLQIFNQTIFEKGKIRVYSSYPFNNKKEILIAAGALQNLKEGDVVTYGDGILVGEITQVTASSSIVKTVFDPAFRLAVRIGKSETDALFTGGNELTLSLIPKKAQISPGDPVITVSRDLPYGLEIGRIGTIEDVESTQFKRAVVEPSFNLQSLRNVTVRPSH